MTFKQPSGLAAAAVFLSAAIWGLFWIPIRLFEELGIGGEWALISLYLPAFVVVLPVVVFDFARQSRHFGAALAIAFFIGAALAMFGVGILHTSVVRATMLFYLTPVWATLIGQFWLGEAPSRRRWIGILLGILGLILLVFERQAVEFNWGDSLALLSGMCWAVGLAGIKRVGEIPIAGLSLFQFMFAVLFIFALERFFSPLDSPLIGENLVEFVGIAGISVCFIVPALFLLAWASRILYPGQVGLLMMSEVLVAIATASIFLPEETLNPTQWTGAVFIIVASMVELVGNPKQ